MAIYNPKSLKAEEFINHEEILDTIRYAEENKHNLALIDEILAKARPVKSADGTQTHCAGLSHREASVLLACDIPEKVAEMYELAEEIKQAFYGNRIVMFARSTSQLLCQWLRVLSVSYEEQTHCPHQADSGRNQTRGDCPAGYGTQAAGH